MKKMIKKISLSLLCALCVIGLACCTLPDATDSASSQDTAPNSIQDDGGSQVSSDDTQSSSVSDSSDDTQDSSVSDSSDDTQDSSVSDSSDDTQDSSVSDSSDDTQDSDSSDSSDDTQNSSPDSSDDTQEDENELPRVPYGAE